MTTDKRLDAVLSATDHISGSLGDIAGAAEGAAVSFEFLDEASDSAGDSVTELEYDVNSLGSSLSGLLDNTTAATAGLEATEEAADEVGDEFDSATRSATTFGASLAAISTPGLGPLSISGAKVPQPDSPDRLSTGVDVDSPNSWGLPETPDLSNLSFDVETPDRSDLSMPDMPSPMAGISGVFGGKASVDVDSEEAKTSIESIRSNLESLPDLQIPTSVTGPQELRAELGRGREEARRMAGALDDIGVDVWGVSSAEALADRLEEGDDAARATSIALDRLSGSASGFMDDALAATGGTEQLEEHIESTGRSAIAAAGELNVLDSSADGAGTQAIQTAGSFSVLDERLDETSDQMLQTAGSAGVLSGSLAGASGASSGLGANLFGLHGSLSALAVALPAIIGLGGSLIGVLGGLTVAASGLAGVVGAGLVASLMSLGETAAARSEEATTSFEGLEIVMSNVRQLAGEALQPLQETEAFQGLGLDVIEGFLTLLNDSAKVAADLAPAVMDVVDSISSSFWANESRFFASLEETTRSLLPYLESAGIFLGENIPDAISWLGDMSEMLAGDLGDLALSGLDVAVGLAEFGATVLNVTAPALSALLDTVSPVVDALGSMPDSLAAAGLAAVAAVPLIGAFTATTFGATLATKGLTAALATLTLPISGTALAIAGLVGAAVGAIQYFGLWNDISAAVGGTLNWLGDVIGDLWNTAVGFAEGFINTIAGVYDALGPLGPILMPGVAAVEGLAWVFNNLGGIMDWVGSKIAGVGQFLGDVWSDVSSFIGGVIDDIAGWFEGMINTAVGAINGMIDAANKLPAVSIDARLSEVDLGKVAQGGSGGGVDLSGLRVGEGGGSGGDGGGPNPPPAQPAGGGGTYIDESTTVNVGDVTAPKEESSAAQIEKQVERRLERGGSRRGKRQRKRNYPNA